MIIVGGKQRNTANKSNNKHATQTIQREHASEAKTRQERRQQEGMGLSEGLGKRVRQVYQVTGKLGEDIGAG